LGYRSKVINCGIVIVDFNHDVFLSQITRIFIGLKDSKKSSNKNIISKRRNCLNFYFVVWVKTQRDKEGQTCYLPNSCNSKKISEI